jgi:uncharacterized membrane protein YbhN (UPF0104 family)
MNALLWIVASTCSGESSGSGMRPGTLAGLELARRRGPPGFVPRKIAPMASEQAVAPARGRVHVHRLLIVALVIVVIGCAAVLFGWDVSGWFKHLWNTITSISVGYLLAAIVLVTVQTTTTAYAWYSILRFGYPHSNVRWIEVLACYAAAVALNSVLPANLGTLTMMLMFTSIIAAAGFAGIFAGYAVQKIFYSLIGIAGYLYLFLTVGGSFDLQLGFISEHPWATVILIAAVAMLVFLVVRVMRERIRKWWEQAKVGGQILVHPRAYFGRVVFPEAISWLAGLAIIGVFLSAYNIPVSFHTIMRVVAGNSIANITSVTPGGAGVQQGFNVLSLKGITSSSNATAYSVAQQLVTTAWGLLFAILVVVRAFGWTGGRTLVSQSYGQAREKTSEQSAARKAKRQAKREARSSGSSADEADQTPDREVQADAG